MKKEDLFNPDFLKQFKTHEELNSFLKSLYSKGLESILEGELDAHLGYPKHDKNNEEKNSRNGYSSKTIKSEYGLSDLRVPRDRDGSFEPRIVPKRITKYRYREPSNFFICQRNE